MSRDRKSGRVRVRSGARGVLTAEGPSGGRVRALSRPSYPTFKLAW